MGSLSGVGIPVVTKTSTSFRKRDYYIQKEDSFTDVETNIVTAKPSLDRPLGSGSIVREGGSVSYRDELVSAVYMMARSSDERIASADQSRVQVVDLAGNQTVTVIPTGLGAPTPQLGVHKGDDFVVVRNSLIDSVLERT